MSRRMGAPKAARQTPSGARPRRGASEGSPPEPLGRPHEARGDARPRGMIAEHHAGDRVEQTEPGLRAAVSRRRRGESFAGVFFAQSIYRSVLRGCAILTSVGRIPTRSLGNTSGPRSVLRGRGASGRFISRSHSLARAVPGHLGAEQRTSPARRHERRHRSRSPSLIEDSLVAASGG
jgi:hypothetical protein